jgi:outer membrane protein TolC
MNFIPLKVPFKTALLLATLALSLHTQAQNVLDQYVEEGLKSNLVLQEKNLTLQQAEQSLQIARSYFLPSVNLLADYTSGEGGRSIAVPIGDLLNPVYASLNQLTQSDRFPQVENVNQNFFPKNFYDARVRTFLPIVNTDLYVNKTIQSQQIVLRQYEVDVYKRQLVLNIKSAYFQYLAAEAAVHIYESALTLVRKNVAVNESLLKNGKSLPATVLRSRSEEERVGSDLNSARNGVINARRYFNFLLNKELDTPINDQYVPTGMLLVDTIKVSVNRREEVRMLLQTNEINQSSLRLNRLSRLPKINAFLDLGSQASDWQYNNDSRYYLVGVQFSLPIFQGFRTNMNIRQNKLNIQRTELSLRNTTRQLEMAAEIAQSDLQTAHQNLLAAEQQLKSAQSYFNLLDKGYQQGVYSLIEFLDARNQLTASQLQQNLRQFDVLTAMARLERETSSYTLQP